MMRIFVFAGLAFLSSCSKSESYSELLSQEEKAVNAFLATQRVENVVPEDGNFITGEDAPFYRLDNDGYVYMQVIDKGNLAVRPEEGDVVYFRFTRENLKYLYLGIESTPDGNAGNPANGWGNTSFVYKNTVLSSTTQWGTGIQMPLKYLGYDSRVNLVLKSYYGFQSDQTYCYPYLIDIKYFKPEY